MTKENNNTIAILSMVAIVAVVAVVTLLMSSSGKGAAVAPASTMDMDGNMAGDARGGMMGVFIQKCMLQMLDGCFDGTAATGKQCFADYENGVFAQRCFKGLFTQ